MTSLLLHVFNLQTPSSSMFFVLSGLISVPRLQRGIHSPLCMAWTLSTRGPPSVLSGLSSSGLASLVREVRPPSCLVSPKFGGPEPCERCELCESQNVTVGWCWWWRQVRSAQRHPPTYQVAGVAGGYSYQ